MQTKKQKSLYNILVFTIISTCIAVALVIALLFERFQMFMPFIVTVEVGLVCVIGYCIYRISRMDADDSAARDNTVITFDNCPDYFVKKVDATGKGTYCSNEYIVAVNGVKYIMKLYPQDSAEANMTFLLPQDHAAAWTTNPAPYPYDKFLLGAIDADTSLKTATARCSPINNSNNGVTANNPYQYYDTLPWTRMRSTCEGV